MFGPSIEDPLSFDLLSFIQILQDNKGSTENGVLGFILECMLGTRSIDLCARAL